MKIFPPLRNVIALIVLGSPTIAADSNPSSIQLVDVTAESGVTFIHTAGGSGQEYIVEGTASGLALFDYDSDGWIDIYFLNGAPLKGTQASEAPRNALYRNNGNWTFTDVTAEAGVGDTGHGQGVAVADYDNDGDPDMYINNFGKNVLYRNNGDKTFTDVTDEAGVGNGDKYGAGVSFLDMEADGDLDLYVANYVDFTYDNHVPIVVKGRRFKAGPQYYHPVPDTLYRNDGGGKFTDVSVESGIAGHAGPSMGVISGDFDDDGDVDVFVCNDGKPNFLFANDGRGNFREQALLMGVACDAFGKNNSSMGVDCSDFNGDGILDLFVTDYQSEMPVLYRGLGQGLFQDATRQARITNELFAHVHWGTGFVDFDNDGDRDLFVACGHFDKIEFLDDRTSHKMPNYLLANQGNGTFVDVSKSAGSGLKIVESSRGAAFDDLDNDGDVDAVILNAETGPSILRNDFPSVNQWVQLQLRGVSDNFDGVGARVRVVAGDLQLNEEVRSGRGYQSHFGNRLYFGLGKQEQVDRVEVTWPNGQRQVLTGVKTNQRIDVVQGS